MQVDDQKASELQSAGDSGAGDINYGGGSRATLLALEEAAAAAGRRGHRDVVRLLTDPPGQCERRRPW